MAPSAPSAENNKALIRRWFEQVWNQGDATLIDQMRARDARAVGLGEKTPETRGASPFKAFYANLRGTFPDLRITIEDLIAEGDKVSARISAEGTHTGHALAPATGRRVKFSGIVMARIANGKIAEAWNNLDQLSLLKQIGALPSETGPDRFLAQ